MKHIKYIIYHIIHIIGTYIYVNSSKLHYYYLLFNKLTLTFFYRDTSI